MHESSIHQGQSISALFKLSNTHIDLKWKRKDNCFLVEFMRLTEKMLDIGEYNLMEIVSKNQFTGAKQTKAF